MNGKKRRKTGLLLPFSSHENEALGREFLQSPEKFVRARGLKLEDLECPKEVHDALERGKAFAADVEASRMQLKPRSIKKLKAIAAKHFGKDCAATVIPFGLKFRDRIVVRPGLDWTASGTGSVTFLDSDADVDD